MKLYVGNLPYNISDDQLRDMFAKFGVPDSARVITDRDSGQSKGFGFVEFSNADQAKQAMSLNGTTRVVIVTPRNYATDNRATVDAIANHAMPEPFSLATYSRG